MLDSLINIVMYNSILELVDAAVPQQQLKCYREIILQVEGVKVMHIF